MPDVAQASSQDQFVVGIDVPSRLDRLKRIVSCDRGSPW